MRTDLFGMTKMRTPASVLFLACSFLACTVSLFWLSLAETRLFCLLLMCMLAACALQDWISGYFSLIWAAFGAAAPVLGFWTGFWQPCLYYWMSAVFAGLFLSFFVIRKRLGSADVWFICFLFLSLGPESSCRIVLLSCISARIYAKAAGADILPLMTFLSFGTASGILLGA